MSEADRHEIERQAKARASEAERPASEAERPASEAERPAEEQDPSGTKRGEIEGGQPGDDGYTVPGAHVGDAYQGQGTDRMGGYGNRAIPKEPGPSQDH